MEGQLKIQNLTKKRAPFTIFSKIPAEKDQQKQFDYGSRNLRLQFTPNFENDQRTALRPANDIIHHPMKEEDEDTDGVMSLKSCSSGGGSIKNIISSSTSLSPNVSTAKQVGTNKDSEKHANSSPTLLHLRVNATCNDDEEDCRIPALNFAKTNIKKNNKSYSYVAMSEHKTYQSCEDPQGCTHSQTAKRNGTNTFIHLDLKGTANQLLSSKQNLQKQVSSSSKLLCLGAKQKSDWEMKSQPAPTKEFHLKMDQKTLLKGNSASMHSSVANGNRARTTDANQMETDTRAPSLVCLQKGVKSSRKPLCLLVNPKFENNVSTDHGASVSGEDKDVDDVIYDSEASVNCEDSLGPGQSSVANGNRTQTTNLIPKEAGNALPGSRGIGKLPTVRETTESVLQRETSASNPSNKDPYVPCMLCSDKFTSKADLAPHLAVHLGKDPPLPPAPSESLEDECTMDSTHEDQLLAASTRTVINEKGNFASDSSHTHSSETGQENRSVKINLATCKDSDTLACTGNSQCTCKCVLCGGIFGKQQQAIAGQINSNSDVPDDDWLSTSSSGTIIMDYDGVETEHCKSDESEEKRSGGVKLHFGQPEDSRCTGDSACKCLLCGWALKSETFFCYICQEQFAREEDFEFHKTTHLYSFIQFSESEHGERKQSEEEPPEHIETYDWAASIREKPGSENMSVRTVITKGSKYIYKSSYECDICHLTFLQKRLFNYHMKTHQEKSSNYECDICHLTFLQKRLFNYHMKTHQEKSSKYECQICHLKFQSRHKYYGHIKTHTNRPPLYQCEFCGKQSDHKATFVQHVRGHTGERPFLCEICGAGFKRGCSLKDHLTSHSSERPWKCHVCEKCFKYKSNLRMHVKSLHEEKRHKCKVCNKAYSRTGTLREHMQIHEGIKPHKCEECGKGFLKKTKLKIHQGSHRGEAKYGPCEFCGKFLTTKFGLTCHRREHTGEKPFQCVECGKCFARKRTLVCHERAHRKKKSVSDSP